MKLDENTGGIITLEHAKKLVIAFETKYNGEINSSFIGSKNIEDIMKQDGCVGLRIYNGYDEEKQRISLVLIGIDADGKEILDDGIIYDDLAVCPPICPIETSLMNK